MLDEKTILQKDLKESSKALEEILIALETSITEKYKSAKEKIESMVGDISETAKKFSPTYQIDKHPWIFISGTVAGGFLLANALKNQIQDRPSSGRVNSSQEVISKSPTFFKNLVETFKPELNLAKDTLLSLAGQWVMEAARKKYSQHEDKFAELEQLLKDRFSQTQNPPKKEVPHETYNY